MSTPKVDKAWVQARVFEYGSIDRSCPEDVRLRAWRDVCRALGVSTKQSSPLEEALKALADGAA